MTHFHVATSFGRFDLEATVQLAGQDVVVVIGGGRAHVGAVAMAQSRPSRRDPEARSASCSVLSVVGHQEDALASMIAKWLSVRLDATVVVVAGMHWDDLTRADIAMIEQHAHQLVALVAEKMQALKVE